MSTPASNRVLPSKEAAHFRNVVRCYEMKQYKKGVKLADSILKKFPKHGETLAMKGLLCMCLDRKEEGYDLVKLGVRNDVRSHVCWHVFGLLHRADRNYAEAIKCYRNALRIDPDNLNILRDLSMLQVHMRDVAGFRETRNRLLTLKPNQRNNWIGFAVALHLSGNVGKAVSALDAYRGTLEEDAKRGFEDSELLLYRNTLLEEEGRLEDALAHLRESEGSMLDKLALQARRASLLLRLGRFEEAEAAYRALLQRNSEGHEYHRGLQCCLLRDASALAHAGPDMPAALLSARGALGAEQEALLLREYDRLAAGAPRSHAFRRLPLEFASGAEFERRFDAYMRHMLRRGMVSLFSDLQHLVHDPSSPRLPVVQRLLGEYVASLRQHHRFPGAEAAEPPTTLLWALLFAAQLQGACGDLLTALRTIDEALAHSPTVIELYLAKARLLKRAGDAHAAAQVIDQGRRLDLADRYVNTKTAKYLLRDGRPREAEDMLALFTKHEGELSQHVYDLQVLWFALESGDCFRRMGKRGQALKQFVNVEKTFLNFKEDEFDFHAYCMRKATLRAYVRLLKFEDKLFGHSMFVRAAHGAIRTYLDLAAQPAEPQGDMLSEEQLNALPAKERKAAKARMRKEAARRRKEEEEEEREVEARRQQRLQESKDAGHRLRKPAAADDDPLGKKLLEKEPLAEAWRFVTLLQANAAEQLDTHLAAFDVAHLRGKPLLALQALHRAARLAGAGHAEVHSRVIQAFSQLQEAAGMHPAVQQVLAASRAELLGARSPLDAAREFLAASRAAGLHQRQSGALALLRLPDATEADRAQAHAVLGELRAEDQVSPLQATAVLATLREVAAKEPERLPAEVVERFVAAGRERFPLAVAFGAPSQADDEAASADAAAAAAAAGPPGGGADM